MQLARKISDFRLIAFAQLALICVAVVMGYMVHARWPIVAGSGFLSGSLLVLGAAARSEKWLRAATVSAWISICLFVIGLPIGPGQIHALNTYHAIMIWLVTAAIALNIGLTADGDGKKRIKILAFTGALLGNFVCLAATYLQNEPVVFHVGLGLALGLLILCKGWFRLSWFGIQLVNTAILFILALPMVDLLTRPTSRRDSQLALANRNYDYAAARKDPAAFRTWWKNYLDQWSKMGGQVFSGDPSGILPFRLQPGSHGCLFDSRIEINSKGFRGNEFPDDKGNCYRIVALGESSTFGCTIYAADRPWPELLEAMIRERLYPRRPVQVINAGVPAYSLEHNLHRLASDILPLKPDLIISYHGANGFYMLDEALPKPFGALPPRYKNRPIKLLADFEYRLKMLRFRRHLNPQRLLDPTGFSNPLSTRYAEAYRQLIEAVGTNGIRLILANYSMAVNQQSDSDAVEFYRTCSPSVHWQIRANVVHSELLNQLVSRYPEVRLVNTRPSLNGKPEMFIDLAHFTQAGRQQMAENIFSGLRRDFEAALVRR